LKRHRNRFHKTDIGRPCHEQTLLMRWRGDLFISALLLSAGAFTAGNRNLLPQLLN
jgi:hypothetical protein